jgi:hypothetical protein
VRLPPCIPRWCPVTSSELGVAERAVETREVPGSTPGEGTSPGPTAGIPAGVGAGHGPLELLAKLAAFSAQRSSVRARHGLRTERCRVRAHQFVVGVASAKLPKRDGYPPSRRRHHAGVAQWQNAILPQWTRGFDSRYPLWLRERGRRTPRAGRPGCAARPDGSPGPQPGQRGRSPPPEYRSTFEGSANGRPPGFGPGHVGSSPTPSATGRGQRAAVDGRPASANLGDRQTPRALVAQLAEAPGSKPGG